MKTAALLRALTPMASLGVLLLPALGWAQSSGVPLLLHGMGALPPQETVAPPSYPAFGAPLVPASVDLRQWAAPVGDQGMTNGCVAWTIAHSMMGWYARRLNMAQTSFAPMYMYSQINIYSMYPAQRGSCPEADCGARVVDGFNLAYTQGVDTKADYFQGNSNWQTPPTAAQRANAANYRFGDRLPQPLFASPSGNTGSSGIMAIQNALANAQPVFIGLRVRPGFAYLTPNVIDTDTRGTSMGGHAVLAVGYDQNGLLIENSWGTSWGTAGFGHIAWAVVGQDVLEAWVVNQAFLGPSTYAVTASASAGGTISPSGAVSVASGATRTFTVTPSAGYSLSNVGGTCGGTLSGSTYTTRAITANCTVTAAFAQATYIVTASTGTGGTINPSGYLSVKSGATQSFTLTPNTGYRAASVGGTCGGTRSGTT
jgi:hypothetical protein